MAKLQNIKFIYIFTLIANTKINYIKNQVKTMKSLWQATSNLPCFPALEGDIKTDVLIIGGGSISVIGSM